jgi:mono/diheme cytochrome c family protein
MADPKPRKIDEQISYNRVFLVCALLFGGVTLWAVWDEVYYRRPWKTYQNAFFQLDARLAKADADARRKDFDESPEVKKLKDELGRLEGELLGSKRQARDKVQAELRTLEFAAFDAEQEFTFAKSQWEEAYYYYTVAKHEAAEQGDEAHRAEEQRMGAVFHTREAEKKRREDFFNEVAKKRDAKKSELGAFTARIDEIKKALDRLGKAAAEAERKSEAAAAKADRGLFSDATEVLQYNLEQIGRVDRCQTCHMGIDRGGLETVSPDYFRTHSLRRTLFKSHPPDKFGCTTCHDGQGRATIIKRSLISGEVLVDYPHAPEGHQFHTHYWERPLLTGPDAQKAPDWYRESNCRNCHMEQYDLRSKLSCDRDVECPKGLTCQAPEGAEAAPGAPLPEKLCSNQDGEAVLWDLAPHLTRGRKIIEEVGCFGCHPIAGYETKPKLAPDLRRVASKIDPGWLVEWIKYPKGIRPHTRMPNFWPEALSRDGYPRTALIDIEGKPVDFVARREEQARALAAFLLESSTPFQVDRAPPGDAARGQALVNAVGCHGCHSIGDKPVDHKNRASHFDHGPDLRGIGSKTSVDWLFTWLKNPKRYNTAARMPNLRLSDQEAADIAAYLVTEKDQRAFSPVPEVVARKAELVEEGKKLVANYGCFGCHLIAGFETTQGIGTELSEFGIKTTDRLDYGDFIVDHHQQTWDNWTYHKLAHPRVYRYERVDARMPQFDLTDEEIWSVMVVLRGMRGNEFVGPLRHDVGDTGRTRERGRELVRYYNCYGCHSVDGFVGDIRQRYKGDLASLAPPILNGEGAKTQPGWLFDFFKNVKPLRPWLKLRMPTFGFRDDEATALVGMFSALDKAEYPYRDYTALRLEGPRRDLAQRVFTELKCLQCHLAGPRTLTPSEAASAAPDLTMARHRLRAEWILSWLKNPNALMPGTRMPGFFLYGANPLANLLAQPGGTAKFHGVEQLAHDSATPEATIELLRDYVMTLGEAGGGVAAKAAGRTRASLR